MTLSSNNTSVKAEAAYMRNSIFKMLFPILASSMLEMLVGLVSIALIGDLPSVAISAMALSQRVRGIIWSIFKGIGIGLQVIVAQAIGANDTERSKMAIAHTLMSIFFVSVFFVITMLVFPDQWLSIFNPNGALKTTGKEVLKIVAWGFPFLGIVIVATSGLQGGQDATTPLLINGLMNIANGVLGYWFVKGGLGLPAMGLMGAAYAMVLAQIIASVFALWILIRSSGILCGVKLLNSFKFLTNHTVLVYKIGFPSVLESLFWNVSGVILTQCLLSYGADAYAAYNLGFQAESLAFMPAMGFQVAATTFVGTYLAANDPLRARAYFREILKWAISVSVLGSLTLIIFPRVILGMMTPNGTLIEIATLYLIICGIAQAPQNIAGVLGGALRGAGYTGLPMITSGIAIYGLRIPLALLSAFVFKWPVIMIFVAIAIDMFIRLLLNGFFYFKSDIYKKPKIL